MGIRQGLRQQADIRQNIGNVGPHQGGAQLPLGQRGAFIIQQGNPAWQANNHNGGQILHPRGQPARGRVGQQWAGNQYNVLPNDGARRGYGRANPVVQPALRAPNPMMLGFQPAANNALAAESKYSPEMTLEEVLNTAARASANVQPQEPVGRMGNPARHSTGAAGGQTNIQWQPSPIGSNPIASEEK